MWIIGRLPGARKQTGTIQLKVTATRPVWVFLLGIWNGDDCLFLASTQLLRFKRTSYEGP